MDGSYNYSTSNIYIVGWIHGVGAWLRMRMPVLQAKLIFRKTWCTQEPLGWDDPLTPELTRECLEFFKSLFLLETMCFSRSLKPNTKTVGGLTGDFL
jgi:hypothetical protein